MLTARQIGQYISCLGLLVILIACDDKKDPYPGFSSLVAERHELRKSISKERQGETAQSREAETAKKVKTEKSPPAFYERQIEITDAVSGKTIAKGVAHLNKEGKITRIKIYRQ